MLERWTPEEDDKLLELHLKRTPISKQIRILGRSEMSIRFRRDYHRLSWHNQRVPVRPSEHKMQYIHEKKNAKGVTYQITKKVDGKLRNFGSWNDPNHAIAERDRLKSVNWNIKKWEKIIEFEPSKKANGHSRKYIYNNNGTWIIKKKVNGKIMSFGSFHQKEHAIAERNLLLECNWDLDKLVETDERINNQTVMLNRSV